MDDQELHRLTTFGERVINKGRQVEVIEALVDALRRKEPKTTIEKADLYLLRWTMRTMHMNRVPGGRRRG